MILWLAVAFACESPVPSAEVASALESASDRFASGDIAGFVTDAQAALGQAPCVRDPLEPRLIAELHRASGLLAFAAQDSGRATTAFAAARGVEPDYSFPTSVIPEVHPIREQYQAVDPTGADRRAVGEPKSGRITFDGRPSLDRPTALPTVWQRFGAGGGVVDTAYLWPDDALPAYDAKRPPSPLVKPMWATAIGAAVVSGGLLGGAAASRAQFDQTQSTAESQGRIDPLMARTNGMLVGSAGVGVVGIGAVVGAVALTRW